MNIEMIPSNRAAIRGNLSRESNLSSGRMSDNETQRHTPTAMPSPIPMTGVPTARCDVPAKNNTVPNGAAVPNAMLVM